MPDGASVAKSMTLQSPLKAYQSQLGVKLVEDTSQKAAIESLDLLFKQLTSAPTQAPIQGLYLWGDVGDAMILAGLFE